MNKKSLLIVGVVTFVVMLAMSVIFFKERTVFIDIAYHLFFILKDGEFAIQNYRFGAIFTQLFPLLSGRLGLALEAVTIAYSASFVLLYFGTFLLILKGIKSEKIALCYLLFCTLMVRHTFYWIQSELTQATAFAFIYFALLYQGLLADNFKKRTKVWMFLLLTVVGFTHPLMPFLMLFVFLFFAFKFPEKWQMMGMQFSIFSAIWLAKMLLFRTVYDKQAMGGILRGLKSMLKDPDLVSNRNFVVYFLHDYHLIIILLITVLIYYAYQKKWFLFLVCAVSFIGYALIINLSESYGADQFYMELRYLFLAAFVIFPFVFDVFPLIKGRNKQLAMICSLLLVSLVFVYRKHDVYTKRLAWTRSFLLKTERHPQKKLIVSDKTLPKETLLLYWAVPYEIWLLSSLETGVTRSVVVEEKEDNLELDYNKSNVFMDKWGSYEYKSFPKMYFHFTDTTTTYIRY